MNAAARAALSTVLLSTRLDRDGKLGTNMLCEIGVGRRRTSRGRCCSSGSSTYERVLPSGMACSSESWRRQPPSGRWLCSDAACRQRGDVMVRTSTAQESSSSRPLLDLSEKMRRRGAQRALRPPGAPPRSTPIGPPRTSSRGAPRAGIPSWRPVRARPTSAVRRPHQRWTRRSRR